MRTRSPGLGKGLKGQKGPKGLKGVNGLSGSGGRSVFSGETLKAGADGTNLVRPPLSPCAWNANRWFGGRTSFRTENPVPSLFLPFSFNLFFVPFCMKPTSSGLTSCYCSSSRPAFPAYRGEGVVCTVAGNVGGNRGSQFPGLARWISRVPTPSLRRGRR